MKHLRITVEGKSYQVTVEKLDGVDSPSASQPASVARTAPATPVAAPPKQATPTAAAGDVTSPLAGIVKSIDVPVGSVVSTGDSVITLEAMKMFTSINAPSAGTVTAVHVKVGDAVDEGQPLYTIS